MEYLLQAIDIPLPAFRKASAACLAFGRHLKDHFIPHARNNYHPHILGDRVLALMSGGLVALKICSIALLSWGPVLPALSSAITPQNIIVLTNQSRTDFNLQALTENDLLDKAAQTKANDMLAKGYFAHNTPDGHTPWDFIASAGYNYLMAGENLAVNFVEAEDVETAWMNSPGHKANILNKNFEQIGIGIAQGEFQGHSAIFVVQMFGLPVEQKIAINDTPTPVQTSEVPVPSSVVPSVPASKVRGAQSAAAPAPIAKPQLSITDAGTQMSGNNIQISAKLAGDPVKVIAYFGDKAIMLAPKDGQNWSGQASLSELAAGNVSVRVKASDIKGATTELQLADFTNSTVQNFNVVSAGSSESTLVNIAGHSVNLKSTEGRIYLFFIAGILASMVLAIGLRRHIQHLNLIANSSFVVIFACLLWMAG